MAGPPEADEAVAVPVPPMLREVLRDGPHPLAADVPRAAGAGLHIAMVGPGPAWPAAPLGEALAERGHVVQGWPGQGRTAADWERADVAIATGWRAAWRVLALPGVHVRLLLVGGDDVARLGAGAARTWAGRALETGMPALCAGGWLADRVRERHGTEAFAFTPGLDEAYTGLPTHRRDDLILLDAPAEQPWRGGALALLAGRELLDRRADLHVGVVRGERPLRLPYPADDLAGADPRERVRAYAAATVGLVCAADGPSPVIAEMAACGLPVVALETALDDLDGPPVSVADADPLSLADAVVELLDDLLARADRSRAGMAWATDRTWEAAAEEVETLILGLLG